MLPKTYVDYSLDGRPVWTQENEDWLQDTWTKEDNELAGRYVLGPAGKAERGLWAQKIHMYQTHLPDLFRYGLKPFIDAKDSSPYLSRQMCDRLSALLLSPVWGDDIGRVGYALQTAVLRRRNGIKLEGSGRPTPMPSLGSQSSLGMDEFARTMQGIAQLEGIVGSQATVRGKGRRGRNGPGDIQPDGQGQIAPADYHGHRNRTRDRPMSS